MRLTKLLSSVALSCITASTTALSCFNQHGYVLDEDPNLTCEGLTLLTDELRRHHCSNDEVALSCPVSCGICCEDDTEFKYQIKNKHKQIKKKPCIWMTRNILRKEKYCFKNWQKRLVRAACPASCGLCPPPNPPPPPVDPWSFLVVADWHAAEFFATEPDKESMYYKEVQDEIKYIRNTFGGDLVVMPGDVNGALPAEAGGGKWDRENFAAIFRPGLKVNQRVRAAGKNCYKAVRDLFAEVGYGKLLVAIGDHEIGGNSWGAKNLRKLNALPAFHSTFTKWFNENSTTNEFLFQKPIGSVPSSPLGTKFEKSSFAYQHKNALFITLDGFKQLPSSFIDREQGHGGEGVITCTVDNEHLEWLEKILRAASKDNSIRFIFLQAHLPIIQPVRKVACSGQFLDGGEKSALWKLMVEYGVDIYFAGEVHANTATQDPNSKLIQIVSRGNQFNNFLKIEVTHHTLTVTAYNEVGTKRMNNHNHTVHGKLMIDKSACAPPGAAPSMHPAAVPSTENSSKRLTGDPIPGNERITGCADTVIYSTGALRLLDRVSALLHFDFEEILSLGNRQVIGLQHDDHRETLVTKSITIRGIKCEESLPNLGSFDQQYDAQVSNVNIVGPCLNTEPCDLQISNVDTFGTQSKTAPKGAERPEVEVDLVERQPIRGNYYAHFAGDESRFGIFGNGPHSPGVGISFALWVNLDNKKRKKSNEMILVHYGHTFSVTDKSPKDIFSLTVDGRGTLRLYTSPTSVLKSKFPYTLAHEWHHIAVSMPRHSCKLSEVVIYVDGKPIPTVKPKKDKHIFFIASGKVSIGGFGHSNDNFESIYPHLSAYKGAVDDFYMWSRPIEHEDFLDMGVNYASVKF